MTPREIIRQLDMQPHPEGGHYIESHREPEKGGARGAISSIYFLLQVGEVSAWHRIDATEIWYFQAGAPLVMTLSPNGHDAEAHHLGPDITRRQRGHVVVPAGCWQTAESLGDWTLVACAVAPAFRFEGFEMAPANWRPTPRR